MYWEAFSADVFIAKKLQSAQRSTAISIEHLEGVMMDPGKCAHLKGSEKIKKIVGNFGSLLL